MRTRIAQVAARARAASVRSCIKRSICLPRRAVVAGFVGVALLLAVALGPTTAWANHLSPTKHRKHAADIALAGARFSIAAGYGRAPIAMRWLAAWKAAHQPPPPPAPVLTDWNSTTTPDWACIRVHESGDRFNSPTAPGGAYGFLEGTWLSLGYSGWPYEAPPSVQDRAVLFLYNELGWQPWSTRFVCGL